MCTLSLSIVRFPRRVHKGKLEFKSCFYKVGQEAEQRGFRQIVCGY